MLSALFSFAKKRPVLTIILLYSGVVIITSWHHEVYRDEVRALSQAVDVQSVWEILGNKREEGHPALWYLMLYYGHNLLQKPQILKILSVAVAILAMYIFVSKSPFSWPQKALFVFGFFPVYEYSVISRNYGITMPLLFAFCYLYPKRFEKIVPIGVILFILAHTSAYSTIVAISICLSLMMEAVVSKKELVKMNVSRTKLIFAFALAILAVVLFVLYMHPVYPRGAWPLDSNPGLVHIKSLLKPIIFPGLYFKDALGFKSGLFASVVIYTMFLYLLRKPFIFLIFFLSVVGIGLFHEWFSSPMEMRQQGLLIILMVVVFWLDRLESHTREYPGLINHIVNKISINIYLFFSVLLIIQVCYAYNAVRQEIFQEYSSSKTFGDLIKERPEFGEAIIIGEPDYPMESLSYYVDNRVYIARESRFGKYVDFKTGKVGLSLDELLKISIKLKKEYDGPILLAIGHRLSDRGPYRIEFSYNKYFTYDPESLMEFRRNTAKVASFRRSRTERYDVFLLK